MKSPEDLNETLAALVDELCDPGESIWAWHRSEDDTVLVSLINCRDIAHAKRMIEIGLGGGKGRSLHFQKTGDGWSLVGQGYWVG